MGTRNQEGAFQLQQLEGSSDASADEVDDDNDNGDEADGDDDNTKSAKRGLYANGISSRSSYRF